MGALHLGGNARERERAEPVRPERLAAVPTGTPRSPLFGALPFTQPMPRLSLQQPVPLTPQARGGEVDACFPGSTGEPPARRLSYHTDFSNSHGAGFRNPRNSHGPMEGRPPFEYFAHQRWPQFFPRQGYVMSLAPIRDGTRFHPNFPDQEREKVWALGAGHTDEFAAAAAA